MGSVGIIAAPAIIPDQGWSIIQGSLEVPLTQTIGRYRILQKVGQGGMGVVYKAYDTLLEREVALKIIGTSLEENPEQRERFFREARAAGQLSHRNIITIHDLGEHDGQPYLAMEFLSGQDLQQRLTRGEPMTLRRKLEVAAEAAEGLGYAHRRGVIHRDVKPANIFITDDGLVKVLDFGLARMMSSEMTRSNMMLGTVNYMAPEQVRGERADHRADIFSFGVVLYEMLSSRKAFQGDSFATTMYKILQEVPEPLHNIDPTLPAEISWLVEKALAKARDERYQDLTDLSRDLAIIRQHLSGGEAITMPGSALSGHRVPSDSPRPSSIQTAPIDVSAAAPPRRRTAVPAFLIAAAIVAAIAGGAYLRFAGQPEPQPAALPQATAPPPAAPQPEPAARPEPAPQAFPAPPGGDTSSQQQARSAEDARARMTDAKALARAAGAAASGSAAYSAATTAERAAGRLYRARRYQDASARFDEARGLFRGAELATRAQPVRAGDGAVGREPQQAPSPAAPQAPAPAPLPSVPTGDAPVQLPSASAPGLPTPPAAAKPQAVISAAEGNASPTPPDTHIREVLRRYEQAMEARNIDALKRVWPTLGGAQEAAVRREFQHARRIEVEIADPSITASGPSATVTFTRRYQITTTDSQTLMSSSRTTMTMRRTGGEWVVEGVRFEPLR